MEKNTSKAEVGEMKTYEVGYLLSPLFPAEAVEQTVDALCQSAIVAAGGEIISRTVPKMRPLAYPVAKSINNKKSVFTDAYFGAVRFTAVPSGVVAIKEALTKDPGVIRVLLITLNRAALAEPAPKRVPLVARRVGSPTPSASRGGEKEKAGEMTAAEIDKEIDELLEVPVA